MAFFISLMIAVILMAIIMNSGKRMNTYYENKLKNAERLLENAQAKGNKNAEAVAYTNIGYIYYKSGDFKKAIVNFNRAIKLTPKNYVGQYWLGMSYFELGNIIEAEKNLKIAAENAPKRKKSLPLYDLGRVYEASNAPAKAIDAYKKSIKDDAKMWNPHAALAALYEKQGKNKLALKEYKRAYMYNKDKSIKKAIDRLKEKVK